LPPVRKRRKKSPDQKTLEDVWKIARRKAFLGRVEKSPVLRRLFHLLTMGMQQVQVARSLGKTRQYISNELAEAMACGLMERKGEGSGICTWDPAPDLLAAMGIGGGLWFSGEVHNFRMTFTWKGNRIKDLARDRRTGYIRTMPMRGGDRLVYWGWGLEEDGTGLQDVTIQVHPRTLLAYVSNPGHVEARDEPEAEQKIRVAVEGAVAEWARLQGVYGDPVEVSRRGKLVTRPHIAWKGDREGPLAPYVGQQVGPFWVDKSPQENADPDHVHLETTSAPHATALDNMINVVGDPAVAAAMKAMPEALADVHGLLAHVQGGASRDARDQQKDAFFMSVMTRLMDRMDGIEKQVRK